MRDYILSAACMLCLISVSYYSYNTLRNLTEQLNTTKSEAIERLNKKDNLIKGILATNQAETQLIQSNIRFTEIPSFQFEDLSLSVSNTKLQLLVLASDLSCDVCQDNLAEFSESIHRNFENIEVITIVSSNSNLYTQQYIRMNQITHPVFHSNSQDFLTLNNISHTPCLLLLDEGKVITAHFPSASFEARSELFYKSLEAAFKASVD